MTQFNREFYADVKRTGEALTVEGNTALLSAVLDGDEVAQRRMIEGNLGLVFSAVRELIRCRPYLANQADDLLSAGYTSLIKAVRRNFISLRSPTALANYLYMTIVRGLYQTIDQSDVIRIPRRSASLAEKNGQKIMPPCVRVNSRLFETGLPLNNKKVEDEEPSYCTQSDAGLLTDDAIATCDMQDLIDSCCQTDADKHLIALREAGYTYAEIARSTHTSISTVYNNFKTIEARVMKKLERLR